jgi:hypothetical protein
MRRFAVSLAIVTPCLLAACGDNLDPEQGELSSVQSGAGEEADAEPEPIREIVAELEVTSPQCWDTVAGYAIRATYADDGSPVETLRCNVRLDGTSSDLCAGEQAVSSPGFHDFVVDVVDVETGATAHLEQRGFIEPRMEINFEWVTPACGLFFDFNLSVPQSTLKQIVVSPADKIVGGDPGPFDQGGRVEVTEPGTYTLSAYIEQERSNGPLCSIAVDRDVQVVACEHEHTPDCAHAAVTYAGANALAASGRIRSCSTSRTSARSRSAPRGSRAKSSSPRAPMTTMTTSRAAATCDHFGMSSEGIVSGRRGTVPAPNSAPAMSG